MGKPYTTREAKEIVDLWVSCEPIKEICEKTGRGEFSVRGIIQRQRERLGSEAVPFAKDRGWTGGAFCQLVEMWNEGAPVAQIAKKIGKEPNEIYEKIKLDRMKHGETNFPKRKQRK